MAEQAGESDAVQVLVMNAEMPLLYIPYPRCDHCDNDVTIEDGVAYCEGCRIEWDRIEDGAPSTPDSGREGTEVPCEIVSGKQNEPHDDQRGNHYVPGPPKPCILPSGHEGGHLCPYDAEVTHPTQDTPS